MKEKQVRGAGGERRAESGEDRAESGERRAKSKEQRAVGRGDKEWKRRKGSKAANGSSVCFKFYLVLLVL